VHEVRWHAPVIAQAALRARAKRADLPARPERAHRTRWRRRVQVVAERRCRNRSAQLRAREHRRRDELLVDDVLRAAYELSDFLHSIHAALPIGSRAAEQSLRAVA
jgi:hypothetical protein